LFIDGRIDDMVSEKFYNLKKGGNMKKFSMLGIAVFSLSLGAYDTAGKFGMGVRFWGSPIITFSTVKYGISNLIEIEPSIGYYTTKSEDEFDGGFRDSEENILFAVLLTNFKPIKTERSNLLIKFGGLYARNSHSYSYLYDDYSYAYSSTTNNYVILFGLGIEHFINDNFSVNVSALSGYWRSKSEEDVYSENFSLTGIGSQIVDFSLIWHL
jgi:hypothetical protein